MRELFVVQPAGKKKKSKVRVSVLLGVGTTFPVGYMWFPPDPF